MRHQSLLAACVLSAFLALAACGRAPSTRPSTVADVPSENGVRNFHTVHAGELYRSGSLARSDFATLGRIGIRTILSFERDGDRTQAIRAEEAAARQHGIEFLRLPIDAAVGPTLAQLDEALGMIRDPAHPRPILVHCLHGADRTGLVIAAYRIRFDGYTVDAAISELRSLGHARSLYWQDEVLNQVL